MYTYVHVCAYIYTHTCIFYALCIQADMYTCMFVSMSVCPMGVCTAGWMMAIQKPNSPGEYQTWRPNTGVYIYEY